jgi:acyl-CoA thioester hydrolase
MPRQVARIQLRWSDVDALGHVNNVVVLRYLQEARVDMLFVDAAARGLGELARGVVVHRHEISYRAPVQIRPEPDRQLVEVETWITKINAASFEIGYEVVDAADGDRTVCAVASSVLVPYDLSAERPRRITADERAVLQAYLDSGPTPDDRAPAAWAETGSVHPVACAVRFDDLDSYGHVNNVMIAEYLQQARIDFNHRYLASSRDGHEQSVVARQSIDYLRPIPFRTDPVRVDLRVTRIGTSSFDMAYQVRDASAVYARAATALVCFDLTTGRPRPLTEGERLALKGFMGS